MYSRYDLFKKIQIYEFLILDVGLYLDTHPMDQEALDYFHHYKALKEKAVADYTTCYGPLTIDTVESTNKWTWIDQPWPWEMEA